MNCLGLVWFKKNGHSSLITQFSSLLTHHYHSKIPQFLITLFVACLGEISNSVLKLHHSPLCQLTGSHKYQLKISVQNGHKSYPRSLSLCVSLLHALSTPKRPQHPKTQNLQNGTVQKPRIANRSDALLPHLKPVYAKPQFLSAFGPGLRISLPLTSPPPLR